MSDNEKKGFDGISKLATDSDEIKPNPSEEKTPEKHKPKRRLPIQADYSEESKDNINSIIIDIIPNIILNKERLKRSDL